MREPDFGWDYPAGCNSTPFNDEPPCVICGEYVDSCTCNECPVCGEIGDPACYAPEKWDIQRDSHGMIDPLSIKCIDDLFLCVGTVVEGSHGEVDYDQSLAYLEKTIYKGTSCGASIGHYGNAVVLESIVEGVDYGTQSHELVFPFSEQSFWDALQNVEDEASEIWNATHGCEDCWDCTQVDEWGSECEFGQWPINPICTSCNGHGTII